MAGAAVAVLVLGAMATEAAAQCRTRVVRRSYGCAPSPAVVYSGPAYYSWPVYYARPTYYPSTVCYPRPVYYPAPVVVSRPVLYTSRVVYPRSGFSFHYSSQRGCRSLGFSFRR